MKWVCCCHRCNRETRHRGVCNARAAAPGFTPPQEDAVVFESSQHELDCVREEEPCDDHNDSEQGECLHVHVNTPDVLRSS